jgi:cytoskeletal protein RodZ
VLEIWDFFRRRLLSPTLFRRKTIRADKTVGELFLDARERLELTLEVAEQATRIRGKYLRALEEGRFSVLPEEVYTLGFVRRYALFLRLDPKLLTSQFRAERLTAHKLGVSPLRETTPALSQLGPIREPRLMVTPKLFWLSASFVVVLVVASYLWYQIHGFLAAPALDLASANGELTVSTPTIAITGRTTGTATVTINAEPVTLDTVGGFRQEVHLEPGLNTIEVAAKNRLNRETKKQVRVMATYPPVQGAAPTVDQQG